MKGIGRDYLVQWIPEPEDAGFEVLRTETDQSGAFFFPDWQWNLRQIHADDAWLTTNQGAGASVAILDTGIDPDHIDLASHVDLGRSTSVLSPGSSPCNFFLGLPDEETIFDFNFHGSFVAGLVASNGIGMGSVAPDATLIGVKVLNCTGSGSFDDVIDGIMHAAYVGADVINMSLGALVSKKDKDLIAGLQRAVDHAIEWGTLVVTSSGNNGLNMDDNRQLRTSRRSSTAC